VWASASLSHSCLSNEQAYDFDSFKVFFAMRGIGHYFGQVLACGMFALMFAISP
jgi:hypothetical protein